MPDLALESRLAAQYGGPIAGADEAGRGPLAGAVIAAAVQFITPPPPELARLLNDSKKLTARKREAAFAALLASPAAQCAIAGASTREIDQLNILHASLLAMARALAKLPTPPRLALIDGNKAPPTPIPTQCVVGGDGISLSIAAASILAKVTRDRAMQRLGMRYPGYGFEQHAGYPTASHQLALTQLGATPHHRRSFAPVRQAIETKKA